MEVALRRRLEGVAEISISQHEQRATVTFVPGTHVFSSEAFRAAVAEADVEVITLDVRVCGLVDENGALQGAAGGHEPLVRLRGDVRPGNSLCATGRLDDNERPYELEVASAETRR
jgi:hypothetical protein